MGEGSRVIGADHVGARGMKRAAPEQLDVIAHAMTQILTAKKREYKGSMLETLTINLNDETEESFDMAFFWTARILTGDVTKSWYNRVIRDLRASNVSREVYEKCFPSATLINKAHAAAQTDLPVTAQRDAPNWIHDAAKSLHAGACSMRISTRERR
eukprot:SAG11_NODE_9144_length_938_cov_3.296782_2_plen_157_part_00